VKNDDRIADEIALCTFCPKMCRVACPVAEATGAEDLTPWGLMTTLGQVRVDHTRLDAETAARFHACTGCGRCRSFCAHGNDVTAAMTEARAQAAGAGFEPASAKEARAKLRDSGNVKGENLAAKQWKLLGERVGAADAKTLFFAGCEAIANGSDALVDAVRVLEHLELGPVALLEDAPCSGRPYESAGYAADFRSHAMRLAERLSRYSLVVSACPGCVHTLTARYAAVGATVRARVVHFVEVVAERLPAEVKPLQLKAAYHDPCHLGRGLGVYDPPRQTLRRAGAEVVEWFDRKETARCSGGGAGLPRTMPDAARAIAARRAGDVPGDADIIATACPTCASQLRPHAQKPVFEIATLVARALGLSG
jgi:Fe-S oxidoreductase